MKLTKAEQGTLKTMLYVFELTMNKQASWESEYLYTLNKLRAKEAKELVNKILESCKTKTKKKSGKKS